MKKIVLAILIVFCFLRDYAQQHIVFYDAATLQSTLDAISEKFTIADNETLLHYYFGATLTDAQLAAQIHANPFLTNYFTLPAGNIPNFNNAAADELGGPPAAVGNLNVANIADGIAQFLIERAEGEIDEAFFSRLKDFLDQYPEFGTLFPNTDAFLAKTNTWEYSNLLNSLKEVFNKDINQIPADIIKLNVLDTTACHVHNTPGSKDCKACVARVNAIRTFLSTPYGLLLLSACQVTNGFLQNQKIPDIINSVVQPDFLLAQNNGAPILGADATNILKLLNIIDLSLESTETGQSYINTDQFNTLKDPTTRDLFLGMLYQQIVRAGITINGINISTTITHANFSGIVNYINNIYTQAKNLQTVIAKLTADKLDAKADLSPDYAALVQTLQQILQALYSVNIIKPEITIPGNLTQLQGYINQGLQIANDIYIKNYNASIMSSLNLIEQVIKDNGTSNTNLDNFCTNFLKYASFAANVVEAKTPDDVKAAIEAVALPSGSYTVKQKSDWNISFNGYLGYGLDFNSLSHLSKGLFANGVYAPVGFSISHGYKQCGIPITLFISIIDVGSFVSYRLTNGSTDSLKEDVRLQSIISPSAQLFFEVPKTPVTIGAGWRLTPQLFYSNKTGAGFTAVPARSVFNVSFLIDIPIFTLHNTPFKDTTH